MITLKPIGRKNPQTKEVKYYPTQAETSPLDIESVAEQIKDNSTFSRGDIKATLNALQKSVIETLLAGYSVRLGDLGSFRPTIRTRSAKTKAEASANLIERVHVHFTPSTNIKRKLHKNNLKFQVKK